MIIGSAILVLLICVFAIITYSIKGFTWVSLVLFSVLSVATLFSLPTLLGHTGHLFVHQRDGRAVLLLTHILTAIPCTLLGPALIYSAFRKSYTSLHRNLGKCYVIFTLLSAVLAMPLSMTNGGGIVGRLGFSTMAVLWFIFTLLAYTSIRNGDTKTHERYMLRSYAMTFAFVNVNVTFHYIGAYNMVNFDPMALKIFQSWVSWIINLLFVEAFLLVRSKKLFAHIGRSRSHTTTVNVGK